MKNIYDDFFEYLCYFFNHKISISSFKKLPLTNIFLLYNHFSLYVYLSD